jgi:hypothetical protein
VLWGVFLFLLLWVLLLLLLCRVYETFESTGWNFGNGYLFVLMSLWLLFIELIFVSLWWYDYVLIIFS